MSKSEAKKIAKQYAKKLKEQKYSFSSMYLFGSYAKGQQNEWSDIDVAIVSNKLRNDKNRFLLWKIRREVDLRIEPHGFTEKDFQNDLDPFVYEIKKTGSKIV